MILKRLKVQKDGEVEATWMLTQEQFQLLLNFAIDSLLSKGLISTLDIDEAEIEAIQKQADEEVQKEFLSNVDPERMYKA